MLATDEIKRPVISVYLQFQCSQRQPRCDGVSRWMFRPESSKPGSGAANSPSVVIIAIDMEHLVALDTENSVRNTGLIGFHGRITREPYPERTHSVRPEGGVL
jgi:hypothetical protein